MSCCICSYIACDASLSLMCVSIAPFAGLRTTWRCMMTCRLHTAATARATGPRMTGIPQQAAPWPAADYSLLVCSKACSNGWNEFKGTVRQHRSHTIRLCPTASGVTAAAAALGPNGGNQPAADQSSMGIAQGSSIPTPTTRRRARLFQDKHEHDSAATAPPDGHSGVSPSVSAINQHESVQTPHSPSDLQEPSPPAMLLQKQDVQQPQTNLLTAATQHVFVFWDLDNKNPSEWLEMPAVIDNLKSALSQLGQVASIAAYSNIHTLTWLVPGEMGHGIDETGENLLTAYEDPWGLASLEQNITADDELRCPLCGRRCKSIEDRNKHFKQLHQREHAKRLGAPKKLVKKYMDSEKAERYRAAFHQVALPRANRSGRKGQMVKLLLQKYGVTLKEVPNDPQAVDIMIKSHITNLTNTLRSQQQQQEQQQQGLDQDLQQQKRKRGKQRNQSSAPASATLSSSVLVLVTDDRGFREVARAWLQRGGAEVVMVSSREPEEWDSGSWQMSSDQRVAWLNWYDLL